MKKYVYLFSEGNKDMKQLLGGKGANLAQMINIGLPVPQGFTITTEACNKYYEDNEFISDSIILEIKENVSKLENITGKKFGDKINPLLLSVRSGARVSMPGMMDTILNLGLNDEIVEFYGDLINNKRFVYDCYRRFIQMYSDVVMNLDKSEFENIITKVKEKENIKLDLDLSENNLKEIIIEYKKLYQKLTNEEFPQNPFKQLVAAVKAVFQSWNNERAIYYRRINEIPSSWGTAVNVQEMVYGNKNLDSGTGVAFTRNPVTGENVLFGEYLMNAQGEDVVAGIRTPKEIATLKELMPDVYFEFERIGKLLEDYYQDMQDMEFTIENKNLYILQTRNGKRTAQAAIKIAVDLVKEQKITKEKAVLMIDPKQLDSLLHPTFNENSLKDAQVIGSGLAASPGSGSGKIYFDAKTLIEKSNAGEDTILVRLETSPEDIEGMNHAKGVLTIHGGMTSHAAVVARGMGICCVCGASDFDIDEENKTLKHISGKTFKEGDWISIDGTTGMIYEGKIKQEEATISGDFKTFMDWVDEFRVLKVRANADTPKDAEIAKNFGAEGIGLCRTEHMFFGENRINSFRKMICATTKEERNVALDEIKPLQKQDFINIFKQMHPYPVVIRYLDPPLHEFLPKNEKDIKELALSLNKSVEEIKNIISSLKEFNPMMGHRGCRLAITYPEILKMQTESIIEAAIEVKKLGLEIELEIMIPLIGSLKELTYLKGLIENWINEILEKENIDLNYKLGTMIEVPRATLIADEIAQNVDFFSFGTNDLTQMTYGFSRDDANKFLKDYYDLGIFEFDPFIKLDQKGVGQLIEKASILGKEANQNLSLGICGEHGGDPSSIEFCHKQKFNYVSCSSYRVVIARVAAAQASLRDKENK
ncbi:MAG: pyruvate, phosphate dikinase [Firmicutes bacterium]|nr:pyruvate, phosphate dikinase [Bacillota bacterium]